MRNRHAVLAKTANSATRLNGRSARWIALKVVQKSMKANAMLKDCGRDEPQNGFPVRSQATGDLPLFLWELRKT
jgi:hypothetical protein